MLKTTYLIKNSIPLVPLSINLPNAPVFLLKWKSIDKEWRCLKTIKAISLVADWDTKEKRESLISPKANDKIFANPYEAINAIISRELEFCVKPDKDKESIVFPRIIGVIRVANLAKMRNTKQKIKKNLNFLDNFFHKKGFRNL